MVKGFLLKMAHFSLSCCSLPDPWALYLRLPAESGHWGYMEASLKLDTKYI